MCCMKIRFRERKVYLQGKEMLEKDTDPFEVAKNVKIIMTLLKSMGLLDDERVLRMKHTEDSMIKLDDIKINPKMIKAFPQAVNARIDQNINSLIRYKAPEGIELPVASHKLG